MTAEIWKPIPGFGGHYEASSLGNVRVKQRTIIKPHSQSGEPCRYTYPERQLKLSPDRKGYVCVNIGVDGKRTKLQVHRAVLMAFVGMPPVGQEACHCNGKSDDNRVENLRWDTHLANNHDRLRHGTYSRGKEHPMVKYSEADIRRIRAGAISFSEAQREFGISLTHFYRVRKGDSWKHLDADAALLTRYPAVPESDIRDDHENSKEAA